MHRVLVTGLGVVSPFGSDLSEYWHHLLRERTSPRPTFEELADRVPNRLIFVCPPVSGASGRGDARAFAMAHHAVAQALLDAGLEPEATGLDTGVVVGTTMGEEARLEAARTSGSPAATEYPFQIAAQLASEFEFAGPNHTISNACTSGLYAIDLAAEAIRNGEADVMVAGGVEAASRIVLACFNRLGALDPERCRPFDKERAGTVLGEGAAFVVLESEASWKRRDGRRPYSEVKGSGWSCDAHQPTAPEPDGEQIARALREALAAARTSAAEVGCVLAHGTGTPLNDAVESSILHQVFGEAGRPPAVTAIKSKIGHSGGASGAFALLTGCLILRHGEIPPTDNLVNREEGLSLRIPVGAPLAERVANVVVNAYAFGGNNISIVLGQP